MRTRFTKGWNARAIQRASCLLSIGLLTGCQTLPSGIGKRKTAETTPPNASVLTTESNLVDFESIPPVPEAKVRLRAETNVKPVVFDQVEPVAATSEMELAWHLSNHAANEPNESTAGVGIADAAAWDASVDAVENQVVDPTLSSPATVTSVNGLRLESLESMAMAAHPSISEARARVAFSDGQAVQAGLPFNPVLQYQSDEIGNEQSSGMHSVQMSQQFVTADKLKLAQQVQAHEAEKRRSQLRATELEVLTRVRSAFASALVAQRRAEIAEQIVSLADESLSSVKTLLEAQEVSRVVWLQARVEAEQARITAENARTQAMAARRGLVAAVGASELPDEPLVGDVATGLDEAPWEALLSEITATSPELSAAGSELERARWSLRLACAQVVPNVTGQIGVGIDTASDDTYASVGVSLPLPIWNRNQGNIRSARASIAEASAAMNRTRLSLEGRLAEAAGRYHMALERYRRLNDSVLPTSEETYSLSQRAFQAGETDYLQLLTIQRTLFNTRLSVLEAAAEARLAAAEIEGLLVTIRD